MKIKKLIKIIACVLVIFFFMRLGAYMVSPGSYANSESYIVDISYRDSEAIMKKLKEEYPQYQNYFCPTYKKDSTLIEIISTITYTKNDTIVEDKYIYKPPKNYFINSKNDTIRYQAGDSIQVEDKDGFIQFYLSNIGYTVSCRVLFLDNPEQTRILLVSAYDKKNEEFKSINTSELTREENKKIKKEFEEQILPKLGKWDYYANALFRFLGLN